MNILNLKIDNKQNHFNLSIDQQISFTGILGVFGHSGSGKTTLLRILAGLNKQAKGDVSFNQQMFQQSGQKLFIDSDKRGVSMVFQDARLFPHLNVEQNLIFAQKRCKKPSLNLKEIIKLTGVETLISQNVDDLSSGEQQRVALARAILSEPQLLLLDEPLSALDRKSKIILINLLKKIQLKLKLPMIYVSHSSEELQQLADQLIVIEQGKILNYGDVHDVFHQLNSTELIKHQTSFTATVDTINEQHGLIEISCHGQPIYFSEAKSYLPKHSKKLIGKSLRCYIFASDISIAVQEPANSSIVNLLSATIIKIEKENAQVLVTLLCQQQQFFASISSFSLEKLNLTINQQVHIQFKANAVRTLTNYTDTSPNNDQRITC